MIVADLKFVNSFDFLFALKFIFITFVVLKCLEVLLTAIRTRTCPPHCPPSNPHFTISEQLSEKAITLPTPTPPQQQCPPTEDGKKEISSPKLRRNDSKTTKQNRKQGSDSKKQPLKQEHENMSQNDYVQNDGLTMNTEIKLPHLRQVACNC